MAAEFGSPDFNAKAAFQPRYNWVKELLNLQAHAGEWARITPDDEGPVTVAAAQQLVQRIKRGRDLGVRITPGEYEATSRQNELWVRYVGGHNE